MHDQPFTVEVILLLGIDTRTDSYFFGLRSNLSAQNNSLN